MEEPPIDSAEVPESPQTKVICPNCEKKISKKAVFCPKCGQRQTAAKVRMRDFLWKLWVTTFHLDSRGLRTLWGVLSPGKLTLAYFKGQQKKYFHPIQFFFIALFFLLLIISIRSKKVESNFQILNFFGDKDAAYVKAQMDMRDSLVKYQDSLPAEWRSAGLKQPMDSLIRLVADKMEGQKSDSFTVDMLGPHYAFAYSDMLRLEPDSLVKFYQIQPGVHQFLLRKFLRSGLHSDELNRFWASSVSWSGLVLIAVMAFWLKLLYWRRGRYLVEHFVLMLHLQTGLLVVLSASLVLRHVFHVSRSIGYLMLVWITLGYFIAFKRYYQQSYGKTLLKWFIFQFLYFFSFLFILLCSVAVSVLLF